MPQIYKKNYKTLETFRCLGDNEFGSIFLTLISLSLSHFVCVSDKFCCEHTHSHIRNFFSCFWHCRRAFIYGERVNTNILIDRYTITMSKIWTKMNGMAKQLNPNPKLYNDSHLTLNTTIVAVIMSSVEVCVCMCVHVYIWIGQSAANRKTEFFNIPTQTQKRALSTFLLLKIFIDAYTAMWTCMSVCVCVHLFG